MLPSLDEDRLCAEAAEKLALTDFGHPHFREGLRQLLDSAEREARLSATGRNILHGLTVMLLSNRLLLAEARRRMPAVFERPLIPPIIIAGLPRSGTTYLHRLLSLDPAHRGVPLWELLRPLPSETPDRRREMAVEGEQVQLTLSPGHDRIHYSRADTPEECVVLQATTFCSALFPSFFAVSSYARWFVAHDQREPYREYLALLRYLQHTQPGLRLTLKAPAHTGSLDVIHETMPSALLIQTHRDPVAVCISANSARASLQRMTTDHIDLRRNALLHLDILPKWTSASMAFQDRHPGLVHNVLYDQLVADPVGTVKSVYERLGLPLTADYSHRLTTYIQENPQNKHGGHRYRSEDFSVTDDEIVSHFGPYIERYGLR